MSDTFQKRFYLIFLITIIFLIPAISPAAPRISFYICAHPDDCALFMNPNLYNDISENTHDSKTGLTNKVVLIYITSGDAGEKWDNSASYPHAREAAALETTRWIADTQTTDLLTKTGKTSEKDFANHRVNVSTYRNTTSYFLRLPDGGMEGKGFERYGFQSVEQLQNNKKNELITIDGKTHYAGKDAISKITAAIIDHESENDKEIAVHVLEPDSDINSGDHSDHRMSGKASIDAIIILNSTEELGSVYGAKRLASNESEGCAPLERNNKDIPIADKNQLLTCDGYSILDKEREHLDRCYLVYKHIGYSIREQNANLQATEIQNKSGSFAVMSDALRRYWGKNPWDEAHTSFLSRNYYSLVAIPDNCSKLQP